MAKTLEEIEALHMKRAEAKGLIPDALLEEPPSTVNEDDVPAPEADDAPAENANEELEQLKAELKRTQDTLSAVQGRLTPAQQKLEEFRRLYETAQQEKERLSANTQEEINTLRQKLEEANSRVDINDILSEDEQELFDETQLQAIVKITDHITRNKIPHIDVESETRRILEEQRSKDIAQYRQNILNDGRKAIGNLKTLVDDVNFNSWMAENDDGFEPIVRSFLQATSHEDIDRYAKAIDSRINKYYREKDGKKPSPKTDARTSLEKAATRSPQSQTKQEVEDKLRLAKQLSRSHNPADIERAKKILDSME